MLSLKTASLWPLPARLACAALAGTLVAALLHAIWLEGLMAAGQVAQALTIGCSPGPPESPPHR